MCGFSGANIGWDLHWYFLTLSPPPPQVALRGGHCGVGVLPVRGPPPPRPAVRRPQLGGDGGRRRTRSGHLLQEELARQGE